MSRTAGVLRCMGLTPAAVLLVVVAAGIAGCGGGDPASSGGASTTVSPTTPSSVPSNASSSTPPASSVPDGTFDCGDYPHQCGAIDQLSKLLAEGSPDLRLRLVTTDRTCPGPAPEGLGGPYPLCNGASPGETRAGFTFYNDVQGFAVSTDRAGSDLSQAADLNTEGFDWRPQTVACKTVDCWSVMVTFGLQRTDNSLAGDSILSFELDISGDGTWMVTYYVTAFIVGDANVLLNGGTITGEPKHSAFSGYSRFLVWRQ